MKIRADKRRLAWSGDTIERELAIYICAKLKLLLRDLVVPCALLPGALLDLMYNADRNNFNVCIHALGLMPAW